MKLLGFIKHTERGKNNVRVSKNRPSRFEGSNQGPE